MRSSRFLPAIWGSFKIAFCSEQWLVGAWSAGLARGQTKHGVCGGPSQSVPPPRTLAAAPCRRRNPATVLVMKGLHQPRSPPASQPRRPGPPRLAAGLPACLPPAPASLACLACLATSLACLVCLAVPASPARRHNSPPAPPSPSEPRPEPRSSKKRQGCSLFPSFPQLCPCGRPAQQKRDMSFKFLRQNLGPKSICGAGEPV